MPVDPFEHLQSALRDRYRVERPLGRGGMALVYLAHDLKHDRQVAIKVLRPELTAMLGRERFLREIQIAAKLNHPHVLALHDSGEAGELLYYVMPYVEGETLEERLRREQQLSIEDAVRIARDVASALAYAHGRGIIHRDIKPGNILLSDGHAVVADFGLARALTQAKSASAITASGITIGTPAYMSPEQVSGESEIDGRSDVYSLGCVLYELLAGDPPYTASNPQGVLAKHAAAQVPSVRTVRSTVPEWLDRAVGRALAKAPADRFGSAGEFEKALELESEYRIGRGRALKRWRTAAVVAGVVGAAVLVWALATGGPGEGTASEKGLDTTRYAVLPFDFPGGLAARLNERQLFEDALVRWKGVTLVDRNQLESILAGKRSRDLSPARTARLIAGIGAGRFVRGEVTRLGDSVRIRAQLYSSAQATRPLQEAIGKAPYPVSGLDAVVRDLTDRLLFRGAPPPSPTEWENGTRSLAARQAWLQGRAALERWDLLGADSSLARATREDAEFAQASLWLAVARAFAGVRTTQWRFQAEQAATRADRLSPRDLLISDALLAQAAETGENACLTWRKVADDDPLDFVGWYGLANCIRLDQIVIRDPTTASGWRFRNSYQEAIRAFRKAFEQLPAAHRAMRSQASGQNLDLFYTSGNLLRPGRATPPDTAAFAAWPSWEGDTLVFIPFPRPDVMRGDPRTRSSTVREAMLHQRELFHQVAMAWATAQPDDSQALETLASALELLGDPSALDTLRRARRVAGDRKLELRLATNEFWLRLKLAIPDDIRGLAAVRALGDSLIHPRLGPDAPPPITLRGIATLLGKAGTAVRFNVAVETRGSGRVSRALVRDAPALEVFAALGGPSDSLREVESRVMSAIETGLLAAERDEARQEYLGLPASMMFPDSRFQSLPKLAGLGDPLLDAQVAAAAGRLDEVLAYIQSRRQAHQRIAPQDLTFDGLYPQARLLLILGDTAGAAAWLDPTLMAVSRAQSTTLSTISGAGSLVRAMALRAELADRLGDAATAARWARAVAELWRGGDDFLQPIVRKMNRLAI
jgi:hypothetical protein